MGALLSLLSSPPRPARLRARRSGVAAALPALVAPQPIEVIASQAAPLCLIGGSWPRRRARPGRLVLLVCRFDQRHRRRYRLLLVAQAEISLPGDGDALRLCS